MFSVAAAMLLVTVLAPISGGEARVKAYYSGDAVYYSGNVVIATTNTGQLELFKAESKKNPVRFAALKSTDPRFNTAADFYDVKLRLESGRLFAYVVDGRSLQKYDISDLKQARRVARVQDGSWDWFGGVTIVGGKVATIGSRGVKVWNNDLVVVDSYPVINKGNNTYNITPAGSDKFLFNVFDKSISIYDREGRQNVDTIPLTFNWGSDWYKRNLYNDKADNAVYVVDDRAVRKINFNGDIKKSFKHTGTFGYDVVPSKDGKHIYFSDGIGVVKLRKSDLQPVDHLYTSTVSLTGGWAMGLKAVDTGSSELLVVFNNTTIIIVDSNLNPVKASGARLAYVTATEEENFPELSEPLFLSVDKNRGVVGSEMILHGGGFGKNENLIVNFAGVESSLQADATGRFNQMMNVPDKAKGYTDIKVKGLETGFSYSLAFKIE